MLTVSELKALVLLQGVKTLGRILWIETLEKSSPNIAQNTIKLSENHYDAIKMHATKAPGTNKQT